MPSSAAHRRGACPTLAEPMATGDGLLVRLPRPDAGYGPDALAALAEAAAACGNGLIDVSARGNLQLRGLRAETIDRLREAIDALGLAPPPGPAIEIEPLAGPDGASARVADAIRCALAERASPLRLAPKLAVVIDAGTVLHLDGVPADIRLVAVAEGWAVSLAGTAAGAVPLGTVADGDAAELVLALLERLAGHGPAARGWTLVEAGDLDGLPGLHAPPSRPERAPAEPIGRHEVAGGIALGIGLPFGRIEAGALIALCRAAGGQGARDVRPAPDRALLVTGLSEVGVAAIAGEASRLGLIVGPADPRRRIHACVGAPACASALLDTRGLAEAVARAAPPLAEPLHLSGCAKGCAHPAPAALTLAGTAEGIAVVRNGRADATPDLMLDPAAAIGWIARHRRTESPQ